MYMKPVEGKLSLIGTAYDSTGVVINNDATSPLNSYAKLTYASVGSIKQEVPGWITVTIKYTDDRYEFYSGANQIFSTHCSVDKLPDFAAYLANTLSDAEKELFDEWLLSTQEAVNTI